jgi:hypothetical protein
MQTKPNKKTSRTQPNAEEKRFMLWLADRPCCECGSDGGVIIDHMYGAMFKHNKEQIGHWAMLGYCATCDAIKTQASPNAYFEHFGHTQADRWSYEIAEYDPNAGKCPTPVFASIMDWGR